MITKKDNTINFCCEPMLEKALAGHIQLILTGGGFFRVFNGTIGGWTARNEECPTMKYCPYCGELINKPRKVKHG